MISRLRPKIKGSTKANPTLNNIKIKVIKKLFQYGKAYLRSRLRMALSEYVFNRLS
jgi:hypothetical protein